MANRVDLVFTCSLSDFFIQDADEWRPEAWKIIRQTPNLIYQILTKRPHLISSRLPADWGDGYSNVWLGVSVEQKRFLSRMRELVKIPARVRFVSAEPLLEDLCPDLEIYVGGFDQIIVGGESGNAFRSMDLDWARHILTVCRWHNISFWFKQSANRWTETGTQIDGQTIQEYPKVYHER
jgi:protein gp37